MTAPERDEKTHLPELDGIRGLAILGVLGSHGVGLIGLFDGQNLSALDKLVRYLMTPLWAGVDLFFVLSGFLITGILLSTRQQERYFRSFYARRFLRIFPVYYFVLTVSLIASYYSEAISAQLPPTAFWKLAYFLYLQNWPAFWHGQKMMGGYWGVYWSLAVEEQFYLVWPLLVFVLKPRSLMHVCVIGFFCALPLRLFLSVSYFSGAFGLAQLTTSRIDGLLLGSACAIYQFLHSRPVPIRWISRATIVGLAIIAYIALFHHVELISTSVWILTFGITGFALLSMSLVALSQHHVEVVQRLLTFHWLRQFGKYSYGIYVYHLFLFLTLRSFWSSHRPLVERLILPERICIIALAIATVFYIAKASYEVFECRFLRLKRYFSPGKPKEFSARASGDL